MGQASGRPVSRWLAAVSLLALAGSTACSARIHDPAFLSVDLEPAQGSCEPGHRCVDVHAEVDGTRVGHGSCELYGPGDPDELSPLATSGELAMNPGDTVVWAVKVPDTYELGALNPVCFPMVEG